MPNSLRRVAPNPQLAPINIVSPGRLGLNLQQSNTILPPEWCTAADNAVIDYSGRVAARLPLNNITTTPVASAVQSIFEQVDAANGNTVIIAYPGGISTSLANPAGSDIHGSVNVTSGAWQFANFNNKIIGFQSGQKIIIRTIGNFATVVESHGTAPTGGVGTAAYGRVWQLQSDGQTIQYCALLDETNWDTTMTNGDGGLFNMQKVWPHGTDTVQAIVAYNHSIVVFGYRNIVFLASPDVTALGMDVTQLAVVDVIEGTGCVDQHTIQHIGDTDLVWLSPTGVQSMQRLLVQRSRPTSTLTKYVRDALIAQLVNETAVNIRSAYSPTYGFYAVSLPASKYTWLVDMRRTWQDPDGEMVAPITRWTVGPTAMFETIERQLYLSGLSTGTVAQYVNGTENGGTYQFVFQTTWMDLGTEIATRFKMLKRIGAVLFVRANTNIVFTFNTDFNPTGTSASINSSGQTGAEWNIAQWSIDEWSGGNLLQLLHVPAFATAQYFQFSITANVAGNFAVQQAELFAKVGKIAH